MWMICILFIENFYTGCKRKRMLTIYSQVEFSENQNTLHPKTLMYNSGVIII